MCPKFILTLAKLTYLHVHILFIHLSKLPAIYVNMDHIPSGNLTVRY